MSNNVTANLTGYCFISVRKWSCRKVMFLHLSVSHSVHGGSAPMHAGIHPPADTPLGIHPPVRHTTPGETPPGPLLRILVQEIFTDTFWLKLNLAEADLETSYFLNSAHVYRILTYVVNINVVRILNVVS